MSSRFAAVSPIFTPSSPFPYVFLSFFLSPPTPHPRDPCCAVGQVVATVQALEAGGDPVVVAINAASAALCVSNIPWDGPAGCVRIGAVCEPSMGPSGVAKIQTA